MKWFKRLLIAFFSLSLLGIAAIAAAYFYVLPDLPDVNSLKTVQLQTPLRIYSRDGKLISQFGEKRRIPVEYEEVPTQLINAVLDTEDARFFEHNGIDPIGIIRAAVILITTGKKSQGASTITQQVARGFFLSNEKTYIRKVKEIFLALKIEKALSKKEILALYLNRSFLGNRAYGVGAAAQVYYGKELNQLTLPEMAMIAGLPQAPSAANPIRNTERAISRRNWVLSRMLEKRNITQAEYQEAINSASTAKYHGAEIDLYAPYVSEMARDYMIQKYGEEAAYTNGYNVYTTISSDLQLMAQESLRDNVFAYDQRHGYRGPVTELWTDTPLSNDEIVAILKRTSSVQGIMPAAVLSVKDQQAQVIDEKGELLTLEWNGLKWARKFISDKRQSLPPKLASDILTAGQQVWIRHNGKHWQLSQIPQVSSATVSLEPHDGAIKTLVGGFSFSQSQFNRVTQAKRQLGSNIKPFIYAAALEKDYTLATLINNAPINKPDTRQGTAWRPKNSPDIYGGPTRLRVGLAQSINVMSVRAMRHTGLDDTIKELIKFGFDPSDLPRNESLALGSASVTPLQVATAFNTFANGGYLVEPYFIDHVTDAYDNMVEQTIPTIACSKPEPSITGPTELTDIDDPFTVMATEVDQENVSSITAEQNVCTNPQAHFAKRVISEQTAFLITEALKSVIWGGGDWSHGTGWNGTAWRASKLIKRHDIAGKTGTTNESRDTWFSGFNPTLTATFWVGFDDHGRQLGRSSWMANGYPDQISGAEAGAKTAGPGWNDYMNKALSGTPEAPVIPPKGIVSARIDLATGKLTRKTDYTTEFEYFVEGTEPKEYVTETQQSGDIFIDNVAEDLFQ
ncbi:MULTISPECIES: PBP1A family penicillin-binding protein [Shewanella]|uniref:penicillin-binding protein 1A n=1 Tax=Shewanella TaxID=22 RepID=UPI000C445559|nr:MULTISPECIES: PBP1A family penicillin-binding protein [Shewanella]NCQ44786.1 PBP1A family penicillin-binding protein [Shewanella frigidimarina]NCO71915.1 PBP1A family penicillin-binding protein [Shewanella vesiculosa]NCP37363.1 PBP1A family penicillin-binding protein [Shewanella vesiculosa]NCP70541.1 PBP1A family penicillin-binding protein [Shewanella vesiculosa]NCP74700.1 PBP1A family penicillin-binding protein [Shewanella vesiculosa]